MCGIAGWVDWEKDLTKEKGTILSMANTLAHRGPDAEGVWLSQRAALAHRRLIVIDPESGQQPMVFQSGRRTFVITFNGEIYNFQELRQELENKGHLFVSRSDTEVLLHSYVEWGIDCVRHVNGLFAFAIWDEEEQKLFLARDHLGVKPLFYTQKNGSLIFGSEIKALLAHPLVKPRVSKENLGHLFSFLPVHVPGETIYENIFEVKPGSWMLFERRGQRSGCYWKLTSAPHTDSLEKTVHTIRSMLDDIVKHQLIADVAVATMLSGGLDSSGVSALAAREFKRQGKTLTTFSLDFKDHEKYFSPNLMHLSLDMPWALKVAEHIGSEQHTVLIDTPDLLENIMAPMLAHDRPGMGQMETSLYLLFRAMKKEATVALSGESADEVFGGYPWFHDPKVLNAQTFPWMAFLENADFHAASYLSPDLTAHYSPEAYILRRYREAVQEVPRLPGENQEAASRRVGFYLNQTRFLPMLLDRKDRMSMAVGFEVRVPFCDYRLVEYVWNIPFEMKNTAGIEKGILRKALENTLPNDVLYRRKSPYPATQNPSYLAGLQKMAALIINNPNAQCRPFIRPEGFKKELSSSPDNFGINLPLEHIIQIEEWLRKYKIEIF